MIIRIDPSDLWGLYSESYVDDARLILTFEPRQEIPSGSRLCHIPGKSTDAYGIRNIFRHPVVRQYNDRENCNEGNAQAAS